MGRLNTVDLLVPTSLNQSLLLFKTLFTYFYINEEVNGTDPFPSVSGPWIMGPFEEQNDSQLHSVQAK